MEPIEEVNADDKWLLAAKAEIADLFGEIQKRLERIGQLLIAAHKRGKNVEVALRKYLHDTYFMRNSDIKAAKKVAEGTILPRHAALFLKSTVPNKLMNLPAKELDKLDANAKVKVKTAIGVVEKSWNDCNMQEKNRVLPNKEGDGFVPPEEQMFVFRTVIHEYDRIRFNKSYLILENKGSKSVSRISLERLKLCGYKIVKI